MNHGRLKDSTFQQGVVNQREPNLAKHTAKSYDERDRTKLHRHRPQIDKVGTDGSQCGNQRLPWQGPAGSQTLKLTVPNVGTRGYHCKELPVPRC